MATLLKSGHRHTPARLITSSNSSILTPRAIPAPPFASRIMSLRSSSSTSSLSTAATRRRCASVMGPCCWFVNNANASSTSVLCASLDAPWSCLWNFSAAIAKKGSYVA